MTIELVSEARCQCGTRARLYKIHDRGYRAECGTCPWRSPVERRAITAQNLGVRHLQRCHNVGPDVPPVAEDWATC